MLELLEIHPGNIAVYQVPVPVSSLSSLRNALNHFRQPMDVLSAAASKWLLFPLSQLFSIRYLSDPCLQEISCPRSSISQFYLEQLQLFEDGVDPVSNPVDFLS